MSHIRTLSVLIAASMLAACGGGDDTAPPGAGTADPTDGTEITVATTDPGTAAPTTPDTVTTEPVATADQSGDPTSTSLADTTAASTPTTTIINDIINITDATPWLVDLPDPVGPLLDTWAERAVADSTPADPPAGIEAQLAWIYADLIELWRGDLRLVAIGMSDAALDPTHRQTSPAAAIDIVGAAASMLADSYTVITANSGLVADPGTPQGQLFATWSDHAQHWVAVAEALRSAMAEARHLESVDQICLLAAIDGDDECDGPGAAAAAQLLTELDDTFAAIDEIDLQEPDWYVPNGFEFDECRAWDAAVATTGLTPDEELRMWISLDGNELDVNFVNLGECGWQDGGEEDPEGDGEADQVTFLAYLTAVAGAVVDSGYDETVYDFGSGAEDERRHFESTSAEATQQILTAARDAGSQLWSTAYDTEFATKLYIVAGIEIDDWVQLDDHQLDWEDLGTRACDGWTMVIEGYSPDQLTAIDAAVNELGLDGTLIPEGCA